MGLTAENVAELYGITREECDELAVRSHQAACRAIDEGKFKDEIVPYVIKGRKGDKVIDTDEHPIRDCTMESMAKLKPVFKENGVVTAANASGINDGAAAVVVMSKEKAASEVESPHMSRCKPNFHMSPALETAPFALICSDASSTLKSSCTASLE